MKNLLYLFLACTITLTSCGSDDDTESSNEDLIIGTWKFTSSSTNGTTDTDNYACNFLGTLEFNNTTMISTYYDGDNCETSETDIATYEIDGNQITVTYSGENDTYTATIETLDNNTLSIKDVADGDVYIDTYTKL